ncbi:MAG: class I SAM-dependent methyltransferase [Chloroflexi bacterium]|nr:class I SAM-dependent methyltransferase [Chloroflexota bacterium]
MQTHHLRRWLRFVWLYGRGKTPWDSGIVPPEIVAWIAQAESAGIPPGRALDLGCGTGTTSVYLAAHGWQTVGVDFVPQAIRRARRKASEQGLNGRVTFRRADVSHPAFLQHEGGFNLVIDVGCLHGLTPDQRSAYAGHLIRLTEPGAIFLLYAFLPGPSRDGRRQIGIDMAELNSRLGPAFEIIANVQGEDTTITRPSAWITLQRSETTS